jgi:FlaA1/EpsC-like NDP-sugar epimerase
MEDHPAHAVTNNLFGTKAIADAAVASGCERFVMISSDKAVNPTSVMGATKRLAERYIQGLQSRTPGTRFSMVRFGNVLAQRLQRAAHLGQPARRGAGPITVTDERMTRYFMTIPEAASPGDPVRRDRRTMPTAARRLRPRHGRARPHHRPRAERFCRSPRHRSE